MARGIYLDAPIGDPVYDGFTFGGQLLYPATDDFSKAEHPGLRAICVRAGFTETWLLAADLADPYSIVVPALGASGLVVGSAQVSYLTAGSFSFVKASYPALVAVDLEVQGAGAAGGGCPAGTAGNVAGSTGGGGGARSTKRVLASALAASETVTVGAGGTGVSGAAGNTGGASSFGAHCSAPGGLGGQILANGLATATAIIYGGFGGAPGVGDIAARGHQAPPITRLAGGSTLGQSPGGASFYSGGGPWTVEANGVPGIFGAGVGGSRNSGAVGVRVGVAGGAGLVIVTLLYGAVAATAVVELWY